jgi:hypothetical protein
MIPQPPVTTVILNAVKDLVRAGESGARLMSQRGDGTCGATFHLRNSLTHRHDARDPSLRSG